MSSTRERQGKARTAHLKKLTVDFQKQGDFSDEWPYYNNIQSFHRTADETEGDEL